MDRLAELVAEKTDGEITPEVFHGGVLGSQPDALEHARRTEVSNFNLGPIGPMVKEANLVSPPSSKACHTCSRFWMARPVTSRHPPWQMPACCLKPVDAGARSFYSQKPINTPADVEGLKIRVMNNDLYIHDLRPWWQSHTHGVCRSAGAEPVLCGWCGKQLSVLQECRSPRGHHALFVERASGYSECICVNTAKFNALSPEMQAAVQAAAEEAALYQRELWAVQSEQARKDVEEAGIAVNEIADKSPFQNAMAAVYDEYLAANPDMKKLVEIAQSTE